MFIINPVSSHPFINTVCQSIFTVLGYLKGGTVIAFDVIVAVVGACRGPISIYTLLADFL